MVVVIGSAQQIIWVVGGWFSRRREIIFGGLRRVFCDKLRFETLFGEFLVRHVGVVLFRGLLGAGSVFRLLCFGSLGILR